MAAIGRVWKTPVTVCLVIVGPQFYVALEFFDRGVPVENLRTGDSNYSKYLKEIQTKPS